MKSLVFKNTGLLFNAISDIFFSYLINFIKFAN